MNRHEIAALLFQNMETVTVMQATINLLVAFICAIVIYAVYFFTSKDVKPTSSFAKTILLVTLSTCLVLMLIGSNLALSLGMVGALSVIRFRAAVKDSRDAAFVFYAIAVGMTTALGVYSLAVIGTLFIGCTVIIFSFMNIGSRTYLLTVISTAYDSRIETEIKKVTGNRYAAIAISLKPNHDADSSSIETVYEIGLKKGTGELCKSISMIDGVLSVNAIIREDA
jgi:uncharacterized membrane protein YhiD involved in acid resistance